jgi:hypothetical protein
MGVNGQLHAPDTLPIVNELPGTHWIEGWMGYRAGMNVELKRKKSLPLLGIKPQPSIL